VRVAVPDGEGFNKLANPATLPPSTGRGTAFSPDGTYLSVAHSVSPFITIYKRDGDTFTKLADPATLPSSTGRGTAFSPDGTYLSVAHESSPFITIYKRDGDTFTKLADPATLPPNTGRGTAFSPDGTYLSVAHLSSPYLTIYKRPQAADVAVSAPLDVTGDFFSSGSFSSTATTTLSGTSAQIISRATTTGELTFIFEDLSITNTSGNGTSTQSVIFEQPPLTTGTFTMAASTSAAFPANATSSFQNIDLQGTEGSPVWLRSTTPGTGWYLDVPGTQINVEYVDVSDSDAGAYNEIIAVASTDSGNNTNWSFGAGQSGAVVSIADHDDTQVNNAFDFRNKTNESFFAFKIIPDVTTATVTELRIALSGVQDVEASDFTNIRLYKDYDDDAQYDISDELLGSGVMTIDDQAGSILFDTDFLATSTMNYLVVADWNAPARSSSMNLNLFSYDVSMEDGEGVISVLGSVRSVQHGRLSQRSGGGGGSSSAVGESAPAGDGVVTGGTSTGGTAIDTNTGGALIGNSPDFKRPTANAGNWTNAQNAYDNTNGTYATDDTGTTNNFTGHSFSVPGSNAIAGIAVKLEVSGTTAAGSIDVQLSWDGGTTWTTAKTTATLTTTDVVATLGGPSDLWGRTWTAAEFSNPNFAIRLTGSPSTNTVQVDEIQVRVYNQATGGGGGGGGAI
jgi:hypothetical protein